MGSKLPAKMIAQANRIHSLVGKLLYKRDAGTGHSVASIRILDSYVDESLEHICISALLVALSILFRVSKSGEGERLAPGIPTLMGPRASQISRNGCGCVKQANPEIVCLAECFCLD